MQEKFIVKKNFMIAPGSEVKASEAAVELELTAEQRESLIGDESIVPFDQAAADQGAAQEGQGAADETKVENTNQETTTPPMKKYTVKEEALVINESTFELNAVIELDEAVAEPLVAAGKLEVVAE